MLHNIMLVLVTALLVFSYHYERNGNPWNFGELVSRLIWGASLATAYIALSLPSTDFGIAICFLPLGYLGLLVPHAWVQNMGTWPKAQKRWPGLLLPTLTDAQWAALSPFRRTMYDFFGMSSVGRIRGLLTFIPLTFLGMKLPVAVAAGLLQGAAQPLSYLIGRFTPFTLFGNAPNSAEWGEFYVGIGWAASLYLAVIWG